MFRRVRMCGMAMAALVFGIVGPVAVLLRPATAAGCRGGPRLITARRDGARKDALLVPRCRAQRGHRRSGLSRPTPVVQGGPSQARRDRLRGHSILDVSCCAQCWHRRSGLRLPACILQGWRNRACHGLVHGHASLCPMFVTVGFGRTSQCASLGSLAI